MFAILKLMALILFRNRTLAIRTNPERHDLIFDIGGWNFSTAYVATILAAIFRGDESEVIQDSAYGLLSSVLGSKRLVGGRCRMLVLLKRSTTRY